MKYVWQRLRGQRFSNRAWRNQLVRWGLLTLALLPATLLLWYPGLPQTHDGYHHKSRLFELDWLLQQGTLYPRWLPHMALLYGLPVLHYYPPFIYYLAEALHFLGFGFLAAFELMIGLGIVAAGWAMYSFARRWGEGAGWVAAIVYTYWPYHLAVAYIRGTYSELWAAVWLPLILHRLTREETPPRLLDVSLAALFALLVLTHHVTAVLFLPVALLWGIGWPVMVGRTKRKVVSNVASIGLGMLLSAFYSLPAIADLNFVRLGVTYDQTAITSTLTPLREIVSSRLTAQYDPTKIRITDSMIALIPAVLYFPALLIGLAQRRDKERAAHNVLAFVTALGSIFMMSDLSEFLWTSLPFLQAVRYSWRIQNFLSLSFSITISIAATAIFISRWRKIAGVSLVLCAFVLSSLPGFRYEAAGYPETGQLLRERDVDLYLLVKYEYLRALTSNLLRVEILEYMPIWASQEEFVFFLPPERPLPDQSPLPARVTVGRQHPLDRAFSVASPEPWTVIFHQFYFPGWQVFVDNRPVTTYPVGSLGLVAADIPAGEHTVRVRYGATPAQRMGAGIAALAFGIWLLTAWRARRGLVALPAAGLAFFLVATWPAWFPGQGGIQPTPQNVLISDRVVLLGSYVPKQEVRPGERLWFSLYWFALAPPQERYKVIVHLTSPDGTPVAINDMEPGFFFTPTTRWMQGEIMEDWYFVDIPPDLPPGEYLLLTGMYPVDRVVNLPMEGGEQVGGRLLVATIEVKP